ncbi:MULTISPECIES: protein kinase [unclassified Pseudovibrio]|uniref:protein kinase domain-containing protein n=1 Tax=unclassified Pseudovibrio TaxID=2627060 RepID=UPI0007AEA133|nr:MULTISPECIES: protein kinase [unclassified Pseudovibrio]KZK98787.1 Protein kinase domain protein [Pseudovibrio sp. W74]KZL09280.1 Protein kinase domain protein [Pseudovibrio sp. Ad14]
MADYDTWMRAVAKVLSIDLPPAQAAAGSANARETPPDNSPIKVQTKPDGTMVIEPDSVPSAFQHGNTSGGKQPYGNMFGISEEHAMDVTGKVSPPVTGGAANAENVLSYDASGVVQDYPYMEDAVIKRPNAYSAGPDSPPTFVGAELLVHEAKILTALGEFDQAPGSENILKLKGAGLTEFGEPFAIREKLKGGSLDDRLPEDKGMDEEPLNDFAGGLLAGVSFLQKRNIFHQDLNIDTIQFREEDSTEPVITSFDYATAHEGVAADCEDGQHFEMEIGGTPNNQPPERFVDGAELSSKVDSWAGGLVLVAAAAGKNAQQELIDELQEFRSGSSNDQSLLDEKLEARLDGTPDNIKGAIKGLLKLSPEERLSAEEALGVVGERAE